MRVFAIYGVAEAWMRTELPDRPFYSYLCRTKKCSIWPYYQGFGPGSGLVNYGPVDAVSDEQQKQICWANKRFRMCFAEPYLACDPELVKAMLPTEEDTPPKDR